MISASVKPMLVALVVVVVVAYCWNKLIFDIIRYNILGRRG